MLDELTGFNTRNILCVPILNKQSESQCSIRIFFEVLITQNTPKHRFDMIIKLREMTEARKKEVEEEKLGLKASLDESRFILYTIYYTV